MGTGSAAGAKRAMAQGKAFARERSGVGKSNCPLNCYLPKQDFTNIPPSRSLPKDPMSTIANRYFASTITI